jgi:hypothetical protein
MKISVAIARMTIEMWARKLIVGSSVVKDP